MATWPGKETGPPEPKGKNEWRIKIQTRMPAPCNKKLWCSATDRDGSKAGQRARALLNGMVRRHIDGCKKCQDGNVQRP